MATYTMEQYIALSAAIAQGALTVEYADKKVTYRSLAEMLQIQGIMAADLGLGSRGKVKYAQHNKGLNECN